MKAIWFGGKNALCRPLKRTDQLVLRERRRLWALKRAAALEAKAARLRLIRERAAQVLP